jgi:hypothetical protein
MTRTRKLAAAIFAMLVLGAVSAPVVSAAPECSPGQHGNPQPGFKPGACR